MGMISSQAISVLPPSMAHPQPTVEPSLRTFVQVRATFFILLPQFFVSFCLNLLFFEAPSRCSRARQTAVSWLLWSNVVVSDAAALSKTADLSLVGETARGCIMLATATYDCCPPHFSCDWGHGFLINE